MTTVYRTTPAQAAQIDPPVPVPTALPYGHPAASRKPQAASRKPRTSRRLPHPGRAQARALRAALAPYVDVVALRRLAAAGADLRYALRCDTVPPELEALLQLLAVLLQPLRREQIKSPVDVAALLMVEMSHLAQEQLRVVLLDTKYRVQAIETLYQGTVNSTCVRVSEVFRGALRHGSAALIVVHNHPSGEPDPSPEDVVLTRQLVEAGQLLECAVLDHVVIGQGSYLSLRAQGLGFPA